MTKRPCKTSENERSSIFTGRRPGLCDVSCGPPFGVSNESKLVPNSQLDFLSMVDGVVGLSEDSANPPVSAALSWNPGS